MLARLILARLTLEKQNCVEPRTTACDAVVRVSQSYAKQTSRMAVYLCAPDKTDQFFLAPCRQVVLHLIKTCVGVDKLLMHCSGSAFCGKSSWTLRQTMLGRKRPRHRLSRSTEGTWYPGLASPSATGRQSVYGAFLPTLVLREVQLERVAVGSATEV